MVKETKNQTIETLRGAVIILVVIGHVIGSGSTGGMKISDDSFLRYFYYTFIDPIQMPLFTIISGWVYSLKPIIKEKSKNFIIKKALRILLPMLVVGVCYFMVQYVTPGTNGKGDLRDIWKLLILPYTLFWYLYSIFLVFIVITLIDIFNKMDTINNWFLIFISSIFILLIRDSVIPYELPNYFSYKGSMYLLPCFLLGVGLKRFEEFFKSTFIYYLIPLLLLLGIVIQQLAWFKIIDYTVLKDNSIGLIIGLCGSIMLLRTRIETRSLIWFGQFAYSIYLFHSFGTAAGRIILKRLDIHSSVLIFIISLSIGLILPIFAEKILDKFKVTRILFLGKD